MVRSKRQLPILSLMLWFVADGPDAQPVKRVLFVTEDDSGLPADIELTQGLRNRLRARWQTRLELYAEYLDLFRFPSPDHLVLRAIQRAFLSDGDYRVEFRVGLADSTIR
jgi:hypothetical protein